MPGTMIIHLPTELLVQVFGLSLLNTHHRHIRKLLLVCKHWNNVIMNAPNLWTNFHITLRHRLDGMVVYNPCLQSVAAYYKACLDRSRKKLLKVTIDASGLNFGSPYNDEDRNDEHWDPRSREDRNLTFRSRLCDFLVGGAEKSNSVRWEELHLHFPTYTYPFDLFSPIFALEAPRLNLLEISTIGHGRYYSETLSKFVEKSSLKTAIVNCDSMVDYFHLRFANLTSLDFKCASRWGGRDPFQPLLKMKSLESLTLCMDSFSDYRRILPRDVFLPRVRVLKLAGDFSSSLLQCFKLPALRRVILIGVDTWGQKLHLPTGIVAQPTELFWEMPSRDGILLDPGLLSRFREFLLDYNTITTIKFPVIAKNLFADLVKGSHKEEGMPYEVLKTWVLDDDSLMMEVAIGY